MLVETFFDVGTCRHILLNVLTGLPYLGDRYGGGNPLRLQHPMILNDYVFLDSRSLATWVKSPGDEDSSLFQFRRALLLHVEDMIIHGYGVTHHQLCVHVMLSQ